MSYLAQDAGFGEAMPAQMTPTSSTQSVLEATCAYALRRCRSAVNAVCWWRRWHVFCYGSSNT